MGEHLRGELPPGTILEGNRMYWLTDLTPHESLPARQAVPRQFFRLVAGPLDLWYEDHSTPNPSVALPSDTTIVRGNKFAWQAALQSQKKKYPVIEGQAVSQVTK